MDINTTSGTQTWPLVPSACGLNQQHQKVRALEDAGAAIVMYSLFEEESSDSQGSTTI
jgi:hypothetical protein